MLLWQKIYLLKYLNIYIKKRVFHSRIQIIIILYTSNCQTNILKQIFDSINIKHKLLGFT